MKLTKTKLKEIIKQEIMEADPSVAKASKPSAKPSIVGKSISMRFKKPKVAGTGGDQVRCGYTEGTGTSGGAGGGGMKAVGEDKIYEAIALMNEADVEIKNVHITWHCK